MIAWAISREHFDRRIDLGMSAIVADVVVLSVPGSVNLRRPSPPPAIPGACLCSPVSRPARVPDASLRPLHVHGAGTDSAFRTGHDVNATT
jgi:hypothetical protein